MKAIYRLSLLTCLIFCNLIMASAIEPSAKIEQEPELIIVNSTDAVKHLEQNETVSLKITYELNFISKKKAQNQALDKFKSLAQSKGYTHLYIDIKESNKEHHEIRKRRLTLEFVGVAYK